MTSSDQPIQNSAAERPATTTWRRWLLRQVGWSAFWLALYVLSIGPMFWYWWDAVYAGGPEWIVIFYGPLMLLAEFVPLFRDLINAYINWWIL